MPGISDKLYPPQERKLEKVKKYWKLLSELAPIHEIYGENRLAPENISIDHFVPWSYVAHDEFWNLHSTTRAINSSKSNHLPEWELYFPRFAGLEYLSYQMMWKYEAVRNEFKKCAREHLNNPEIGHRLYREGLGAEEFTQKLREVVYPVYCSAKTCGFSSWEYEPGPRQVSVFKGQHFFQSETDQGKSRSQEGDFFFYSLSKSLAPINLVQSLLKNKSIFPVGPLRCLATISSVG